jgi:hypothetical protein
MSAALQSIVRLMPFNSKVKSPLGTDCVRLLRVHCIYKICNCGHGLHTTTRWDIQQNLVGCEMDTPDKNRSKTVNNEDHNRKTLNMSCLILHIIITCP